MGDKKKGRKARRVAPIDGFVPSGRQIELPKSASAPLGKRKSIPILGGLGRSLEGFEPMRSAPGGPSASPEGDNFALDEPILLDDIDTKDKKQKKPRSRRRKIALRSAALIAIILVLIPLYLLGKAYITERHLFRGGGGAPALAANIDINQLKGEGDGRINVLLLGIGGPGHDGPDLTDTMLIASIDPVNNKVALLSIPRDLWVKIPGNGYQKINAAYPDGKLESKAKTLAGKEADGLKLLDQTLEPVVGIPIHYHAVVDFAAFKDMVDALGGVTFSVPSELYDPTIAWENFNNPVIAKPGLQTMHGPQALLYARSRETSSDFARAERQRQLLVAIKDKALSAGTFSNPIRISNLLSSLGNNVFTDFSLNDMTRLYQITNKIPSGSISSLDLVTPPHNLLTTGSVGGLSVVEPRAGMFDYSAVQDYIRNTLKDGFIAKENAAIAVYNATSINALATTKATLLKSYGYNVNSVANALTATNPATTTLVDLSKGKDKYTRHYLEERFNTTALTRLPATAGLTPPVGTDFVIILGRDAATSS